MGKKKQKQKEKVQPKLLKLDLGCGQNKKPDFTGVDFVKIPGVDIVHDLNKHPWPFKDNSVDEIHCSHFVEHVKDLVAFMDECFRIMKPGAKMYVAAPYYNSIRCWQDPYHVRAISEATFLYFNAGWRKMNKLDHYPIKSDFDYTYGYSMDQVWASKNEETRNFGIRHYMNVVNDIEFIFTKRESE